MENRNKSDKDSDEEKILTKKQKRSHATDLLYFFQNFDVNTTSTPAPLVPDTKSEAIPLDDFFDKYYPIDVSLKKQILDQCSLDELQQLSVLMNKLHQMELLSSEIIKTCFLNSGNKSCDSRGFDNKSKIDFWSIWSSVAEEHLLAMLIAKEKYAKIFQFVSIMRHEYAMLFDKNEYEKSFYGQIRFRMHNDIYSLQRQKDSMTNATTTQNIIKLLETQLSSPNFRSKLGEYGFNESDSTENESNAALFGTSVKAKSYFAPNGTELRLVYFGVSHQLREVVYCLPATTEMIDLSMEFHSLPFEDFKEIIQGEKDAAPLFKETSFTMAEDFFNKLFQQGELDKAELMRELADLIFVICRECPIERGTAAIGQWLIRSTVRYLYPESKPIMDFKINGIPYDIYAQCIMVKDEFVKNFLATVEQYLPSATIEKSPSF